MASQGVVTLRTGFEMAAGDYEAVMSAIEAYGLSCACVARNELMRKILDPEYPITGYTRTSLIEKGVLDADGTMSENLQQVLLAALPIEGSDIAIKAQGEHCPVMIFRDEHLLA